MGGVDKPVVSSVTPIQYTNVCVSDCYSKTNASVVDSDLLLKAVDGRECDV